MPEVAVNNVRLFYEDQGTGLESVFFAHGLGLNGRMFHHQVLALRDRFRCITMDFRGQGRSETTDFGYDVDNLTQDVARLVQRLGAAPCHFVGLSMGGFVGLRLALQRPELLRSLTLLNTGAEAEPAADRLQYMAMIVTARVFGLRPLAGAVMRRLFGASFLDDPARAEERKRWREQLLAQDRKGITRAARGIVSRKAISADIGRIRVPTLIIGGSEDIAQPPFLSQRLHEQIPRSKLIVLPRVGHACCIEAPEQVNQHLRAFLSEI